MKGNRLIIIKKKNKRQGNALDQKPIFAGSTATEGCNLGQITEGDWYQ